jgi:PAS domain S-box-containing protein
VPSLEKTFLCDRSPRLTRLLDDNFLFERLPVGVCVCDREGSIIRYNRAAADLWAREPRLGDPTEHFDGSCRLLGLDDHDIPPAESPMAMALATGQGCHDQRIRMELPDARRITTLANIEVLKDDDGYILGAVNVFRESAPNRHASEVRNGGVSSLEQILRSLPVAIYTTDAAGRITFYNDAAAELWGVRPEIGRSEFCGSWRLYLPDGTFCPHDECTMAIALKEGRAIKGQEAEAERPDGTRVAFLAYATPLFDEPGQVAGAVNMLVDISRRREAELASQRLAAIVESSDDAIISKDVNGIITSWNRGAERLFGYREHEVIGKPVTILIPCDRQDEEPEILDRIRRGERIEHYETIRQRKDGSLVDISLSGSPLVDSSGKVVGASKIARDISDRRCAEEQKDRLLGEMNHRVKNLFALAEGLVNLSAREATSVSELVSSLQGRFLALARAHSLTLSTTTEPDSHGVATLRALITEVMKPYLDGEASEHRIVVTGPDVPLGRRAVTNVALLFHEFATNALKYGALANPSGQVRIECSQQGDDVCINWKEARTASHADELGHEGFGSRLARATISSLNGRFFREFTSSGLEIQLIVPKAQMHA